MKQLELTFFKLHNKLSSAQPTLKEASLFPILCTIQCFFSNLHKKYRTKQNVHLMINYIIKDNEKE